MGMYAGANMGRWKGCIQQEDINGKRISMEILVGVGLQA